MIARLKPVRLQGAVDAPPSKSLAHRYLIGAALSGHTCRLMGVGCSEDVLATVDCLRALGASVVVNGDSVTVDPQNFMQTDCPALPCRESGSTLRFLLPLTLCLGNPVTFLGSDRLLKRPLDVYEELCRDQGFVFHKNEGTLSVCGRLDGGVYQVRGEVSSQFISGLIFALVFIGKKAAIQIVPPFVSRPYVDLTLSVLEEYGAKAFFSDPHTIAIYPSILHGYDGRIEGDLSNAAFLDAFNWLGSQVTVGNLNPNSLQGDRVYRRYFQQIAEGVPALDISDCPDLGPILFALAAMKNGATFTGTDRLKAKESNRIASMQEELQKLGGRLIVGEDTVTIPKQTLRYRGETLDGHNDHRIVMALSVILSVIGGDIVGVEAVKKSYPDFFEDIQRLGAHVEWD